MMSGAVKLIIPQNCLVLWSSKTLHGTSPGTRDRPPYFGMEPDVDVAVDVDADMNVNVGKTKDISPPILVPNRLTCFLAMLPRELRHKSEVAKKQHVYISGGSTSHWANMGEVHRVNTCGVMGGRLSKGGAIPKNRMALL